MRGRDRGAPTCRSHALLHHANPHAPPQPLAVLPQRASMRAGKKVVSRVPSGRASATPAHKQESRGKGGAQSAQRGAPGEAPRQRRQAQPRGAARAGVPQRDEAVQQADAPPNFLGSQRRGSATSRVRS